MTCKIKKQQFFLPLLSSRVILIWDKDMYKILIIDDEYLVRCGLRQTIDWASFNAEIIGEATNGQQGFEMAQFLEPDLIISDVRMPIMNGVELAAKLKEHNFAGKIIILSGYSDFEYAKSTFESGVAAYVLKPVDNDELVETVKNVLESLTAERTESALFEGLTMQLPVVRQTLVRDILIGNVVIEEEIRTKAGLFNLYLPEKGYVVEVKLDNESEEDYARIMLVKKILEEHIPTIKEIFVFDRFLIFFCNTHDESFVEQTLKKFIEIFERKADFIISIVFAHYGRLNELHHAYQTAQKIASSKILIGINSVSSENTGFINLKKPVIDAIKYISEHYDEDLSVKKVADAVNVSDSHLMHLFKENLNRTFNDVLTTYRMNIAKRLLRSKNYRVNEVATMVGYNDSKYFSTVFNKTFNELPSTYMDRY